MPPRFYWQGPEGEFDVEVPFTKLNVFLLKCHELEISPTIFDSDNECISCKLTVSKDGALASMGKCNSPVIYNGIIRISDPSNYEEDKTDMLEITRSFKFIKNTRFYHKLRTIFDL